MPYWKEMSLSIRIFLVHGNYNYEGGKAAYEKLKDKEITAAFCSTICQPTAL